MSDTETEAAGELEETPDIAALEGSNAIPDPPEDGPSPEPSQKPRRKKPRRKPRRAAYRGR